MTIKKQEPSGEESNGTRAYVCNKYKYLRVGSKIKFEGGLFVTDDLALQQLIETNDLWQIHIWARE
tara:strand:+ start:199 stop:396 length:198 start_codon:yes stop_codon:yes gene_type:complete